MSALHPASEAAAVELCPACTVHMQILRDMLLPSGYRHDDLECRSGSKLRLNGFVEQRFIWIGDEFVPLVTGDADGKIIRIEGRSADHGEDFTCVRIHGDNGTVLSFQRLLCRNLQIDID